MTVINLKRYDYPLVKTNTFMEVSEEVAEVLLQLHREENNRINKRIYHKVYFSLDCDDGIENDAIGCEQPSLEELVIQVEDEAAHELLLELFAGGYRHSHAHAGPPPAYALYAGNEISGDCRGYQPDTGQRFRAGRSQKAKELFQKAEVDAT